MAEITKESFHSRFEKYFKDNPQAWLMIRPDRPLDPPEHRYPDEDARKKGNDAMRDWFEYLAAKGFISTFNAWRGIIKSGQSIMVVSADPLVFDNEFVPPVKNVLPPDFWHEWQQSHVPIDHRWDNLSPQQKERKAQIVKIARDLAHELRMYGAKRPPSPPVRPLREWKSIPLEKIDASKPLPKLSEAALKTLGCIIPEVPK